MIILKYINNKHTYPVHLFFSKNKIIIKIFKLSPLNVSKYLPLMPSGWKVNIDKRNWPKKVPKELYIELIERPRLLTDDEMEILINKIRAHIELSKSLPPQHKIIKFCSNLMNIAIDKSQLNKILEKIKNIYTLI